MKYSNLVHNGDFCRFFKYLNVSQYTSCNEIILSIHRALLPTLDMFISPYDTLFIPVKISLISHQVFSRYQHRVLPLRSVIGLIVPLRKAYFAGSNRIRGG